MFLDNFVVNRRLLPIKTTYFFLCAAIFTMFLDNFEVNRRLLPIKTTYFFLCAGMGCIVEFIPIIFKQLGLGAAQVGVITGLTPFVTFPIRPLIGRVADRTSRHKVAFAICVTLCSVSYSLLYLVPRYLIPTPSQDNRTLSMFPECYCNTSEVDYEDDNELVTLPCQLTTSGLRPQENETGSCITTWRDSFLICTAINDTSLHNKNVNAEEILNTCSFQKNSTLGTYDGRDTRCNDSVVNKLTTCLKENYFNSTFQCLDACDGEVDEHYQHVKLFLVILFLHLLCGVFRWPISNLLDTITYFSLEHGKDTFGRQRLWGSIGYLITAPISMFLTDTVSHSGNADYSFCFILFVAMSCCTILFSCFLEDQPIQRCSEMSTNVSQLLSNREISVFFITVVALGTASEGVGSFVFWYMKEIGSSHLVIGISIALRDVADVVCMFLSGSVIDKIGHSACLSLIPLAYVLRFLGYSLVTDPLYFLPLEVLRGITFGFMYPVISSYANILAPPGMEATMQAIVDGLRTGLGAGFGAVMCGALLDRQTGVGPVWTFRIFGLFAGLILVFNIAMDGLYLNKCTHYLNRQEKDPTSLDTVNGSGSNETSRLVLDSRMLDKSDLPQTLE